MPVITGPEQVRVPEVFKGSHNLRVPKTLMITGEASDAGSVMKINDLLASLVYWRSDSHIYTAGTSLLCLTLPWVVGARDIKHRHAIDLVRGYGLEEGQSTEALFVGKRFGKLQPESLIWLGRALSAPHIERTYYLDQSGRRSGLAGLPEIDGDLRVITDPMDVFNLVATNGSDREIPFSKALFLAQQAEVTEI